MHPGGVPYVVGTACERKKQALSAARTYAACEPNVTPAVVAERSADMPSTFDAYHGRRGPDLGEGHGFVQQVVRTRVQSHGRGVIFIRSLRQRDYHGTRCCDTRPSYMAWHCWSPGRSSMRSRRSAAAMATCCGSSLRIAAWTRVRSTKSLWASLPPIICAIACHG